jgi:hypothetical protein
MAFLDKGSTLVRTASFYEGEPRFAEIFMTDS